MKVIKPIYATLKVALRFMRCMSHRVVYDRQYCPDRQPVTMKVTYSFAVLRFGKVAYTDLETKYVIHFEQYGS